MGALRHPVLLFPASPSGETLLKVPLYPTWNSFLKGKVLAQEHQDRVLSTSEIYLPQRDKKQGIRDKDRRKRMKKKGEKNKGKGKEIFVQEGTWTKHYLWVDRRQM